MMYPHDLQHSKLSHDKLKIDLTLKTKIMISVPTIRRKIQLWKFFQPTCDLLHSPTQYSYKMVISNSSDSGSRQRTKRRFAVIMMT